MSVLFFLNLLTAIRIGIVDDLSVEQLDNTGRILFRKLRIVSYHDHQLIPGDLLQQFHNLQARLRIESSSWLVGKKDIRIVDQRPCNSNSLHLSAGHLVWFFMDMIAETDLFQYGDGLFLSLLL